MTDSQYLDRAIDFIAKREEASDYICCALHAIPKEYDICANDCENINRNCVLRFLKNYKGGKK